LTCVEHQLTAITSFLSYDAANFSRCISISDIKTEAQAGRSLIVAPSFRRCVHPHRLRLTRRGRAGGGVPWPHLRVRFTQGVGRVTYSIRQDQTRNEESTAACELTTEKYRQDPHVAAQSLRISIYRALPPPCRRAIIANVIRRTFGVTSSPGRRRPNPARNNWTA